MLPLHIGYFAQPSHWAFFLHGTFTLYKKVAFYPKKPLKTLMRGFFRENLYQREPQNGLKKVSVDHKLQFTFLQFDQIFCNG